MFRRRFAILAIVAVLAACGGGGGGGGSSQAPTAPGTTAPTSAPAGYAKAAFVVTVPIAGSSAAAKWRAAAAKVHVQSGTRSPKYIQPGAQSITFTLVKTSNTSVTPGTTSPAYALTPGSAGCTTNESAQTVACTIQLQAPIGEDIYSAEVYATTDGSGTNIGSGATYINVQNNTTNTASLTLAGSITNVYLSTNVALTGANTDGGVEVAYLTSDPTAYPYPQSARIFVIGLDANGDQIISPDEFSTPVTLALQTDTSQDTLHKRAAATTSQKVKPLEELTDILQLTATYANPQNGVTTASTSDANQTLMVYSPADVITATPIGTQTSWQLLDVIATVGESQSTLAFETTPNTTATPTPTPTASPTAPLVWTNVDNYDGFEPGTNNGAWNPGSAVFEAGWDPNLSYTGYTFQLTEQAGQGGATVNIDATGCEGTIQSVLPVSSPSPQPTASPTASPSPGPFTVSTTASNPQVTFYVPVAPAPTTCPVTAIDNVTNYQVTLDFSFTEGGITVQKHAQKPAGALK